LIRLHAVVEGQTEETFIREILAPELSVKGVFMDAHRITTGRKRAHKFRGGFVQYDHLKRDLLLWMNQDRHADAWFTTMVDLYRLPKEFPGYHDCQRHKGPIERADCLERSLGADIAARRFIPYIQVHEFEALLFSDAQKFSMAFPDEPDSVKNLAAIRNEFESPEHINDRPEWAPSERILRALPQYVKTVAGLLIVQQIGLANLRKACLHFDGWMRRLEQLAR